MKRFACVVALCLAASLGFGVSPAMAQVAPPPGPALYGEFEFGPTLGHTSDMFFGGEFGLRVTGNLFAFIEGGHMGNVGTSDLDDRATIIANYLGGTASTAYKVNYGNIGLRYNFTVSPKVKPYVLGGVGIAQVETVADFFVKGAPVDPAASGVQLGSDLSGTLNKTMIVFGFGANMPFGERFFADFGYRYGSILAKTSEIENDTAIPTQRIVLGAGIRF